jgi:hypothetical protein
MERCLKCRERAGWGRSPLCFYCLGESGLLVTASGAVANPDRPSREPLYAARYRYRGVRCGKDGCRKCPHDWYVYRAWRVDGRARERYLGPSDAEGDAYERPKLRTVCVRARGGER